MRRSDDENAANLTSEAWASVRGRLLIRCGGRCEACGGRLEPDRYSLHHRDSRGMGGSQRLSQNVLSNLLVMDGSGSSGCHGWAHAHPKWARELGWILPTSHDVLRVSAATPVTLYSGRRVLLDPLAPGYLTAEGPSYDLGPHPFRDR